MDPYTRSIAHPLLALVLCFNDFRIKSHLHSPNLNPRFDALPESQLIDMTRPVGCVNSITQIRQSSHPNHLERSFPPLY